MGLTYLPADSLTYAVYWDSWDGNVGRRAPSVGLIEGKLVMAGGEETKEKHKELFQFNMGGYMMMFDGVDDEIMIPHLPTIIQTQVWTHDVLTD